MQTEISILFLSCKLDWKLLYSLEHLTVLVKNLITEYYFIYFFLMLHNMQTKNHYMYSPNPSSMGRVCNTRSFSKQTKADLNSVFFLD